MKMLSVFGRTSGRRIMTKLSDRVEALTGPCRETDLAIATAIRPEQPSDKWAGRRQAKVAKAFTGSVDAALAMVLVPEGWRGSIEYIVSTLFVVHLIEREGRSEVFARAATPAIALCAAALRARGL
jgi:hypothetical protein